MLPLLRDKDIWTLGSDRPDIDWETTWKGYLRDLPNYSRNGGTTCSKATQCRLIAVLRSVRCRLTSFATRELHCAVKQRMQQAAGSTGTQSREYAFPVMLQVSAPP